jgi:anthranilate synthase component 2
MYLLIDNYDSFTYNLYHFLGELGAEVEVRRNDALSADEAMAMEPQGIVLSPGPCDPDKAGICLDLVAAAAGKVPVLGVCLGAQAVGQAFGGKVVRAEVCMHGKMSDIRHDGQGVFADLPSPFQATRYHSLVIERDSLPESGTACRTAWRSPRRPRTARSWACGIGSTSSTACSSTRKALLRSMATRYFATSWPALDTTPKRGKHGRRHD